MKTQNNFVKGLIDLEEYTMDVYKKKYTNCSSSEKITILKRYESKSHFKTNLLDKISKKIFGKPFYFILKELTVEGYCTSMIGATQGLAYDYIPGDQIGCIPLKTHQKSWATR